MKILIKGYYGFKNFGDEFILLALLTRIEGQYHPYSISILSGDKKRLEQWILQHKNFIPPIFKKLRFLPMPSLREQTKMIFGWEKEKYDLVIFGGGEVIDESRTFPHDGWNIPLLYRKYINKKKFILIGGFGSFQKKRTKILQNILFQKAKNIGARDLKSFKRALFLVRDKEKKKIHLLGDFTLPFLEESKTILSQKDIKNERGDYILINMDSSCTKEDSLNKIHNFIQQYPHCQPIYMAMDLKNELPCFRFLQNHFPSLTFFDRSSEGLIHTLKCFYFAQAGIGTKLHFLYPLKFFGKKITILNPHYKVENNLRDLDHQEEISQQYQRE